MRVRLDSKGRPLPSPSASSSRPTVPITTTTTTAPPFLPVSVTPTPSITTAHPRPTPTPALPSVTPKPPSPPPKLSPSQKPCADDERSSDTSSILTEAYNSEDEHVSHTSEPPIPTLRDRERIFARQLASRGLLIVEMRADGNCQFRALAHVLWNDAELHATLRTKVLEYLLQERDYFSQFVAEDFTRYVRRKRRDGTHGNHLELQAAAELFARPIEVYSYSDTPATIIEPWGTPSDPSSPPPSPIRLSFHRGNHYNAIQAMPSHASTVDKAGASNQKRVAMASGSPVDDLQRVAAADAQATQDEMERAVLALSLVEATRGDSAAGSSASSSTVMLPSTVLALIHSGYSEQQAREAYRVAGHGGLSEMVRYLTTDFFQQGVTRRGREGGGAGSSRRSGEMERRNKVLRKEGEEGGHAEGDSIGKREGSVE